MALIVEKLKDEELAVMALNNEEALRELIRRYEKPLFFYIRRLIHLSEEETQDILQEVFIKIYYHLNDFDNKLKFSSWAYRIAHNEAISEVRKKRHTNKPLEAELLEIKAESDLLESACRSFEYGKIAEALDRMKTKYREIILLRYFEDQDYKEISDILKKPLGSVATLVSRAKDNFKQEYLKICKKP